MKEVLDFMGEHYIVTLLLAWSAASVLKMPFWSINRYFRSRNIKHHGWPSNPHMDADGDLVYPEKDE